MPERLEQARMIKVHDFLCHTCGKRHHHMDMDFSCKVATCKDCSRK